MNVWVLVLAAFINGELLIAAQEDENHKLVLHKTIQSCEAERTKLYLQLEATAQHPFEVKCLQKREWDKFLQKQEKKEGV